MKRQILAFLMLCFGLSTLAQQITKYEYWLDTSHAERTTQATGTGNLEFAIDVGNLCPGLHALYFRAQDSEGKWSSPSSSYFFCMDNESTSQGISQYEYWLDQNVTERVITNGQGSTINLDIDISTLLTGLHTFIFRYKDDRGHWSVPQTIYFLVPIRQNGSDIQNTYEYWIDNKQGEKVQVKGYNGVIDLSLDVNTLPAGLHSLSFRATDKNGIWSAPQTSYFLVPIRQNGSDIQNTYEYWLDNKQNEKVQVEGHNGVIDLSVDVNTLPTGLHSLSFRATDQNGIWSAPQTNYFYVPVNKNLNQDIKAYCYWFNDAFENRITETVSPSVIPFTLDAKLTASDVVTDITPENITMADDGEGHMKLATKNILHTQFCTEDGRWTGFSVDTFAVVVNAPEVDLTGFIKNPDASSKWNGWTTEGSTIGIQCSQTWQNGGNYFRLGNTSKNEWNSSMQQTITGLPAGTYILSAKGRAAEGVEIEISVNGFTDTFPATGTEGGELTNGWTERSLIFTTDGQPFVIKVSGSANSSGKWMDIADFRLTYSNMSNASLTVNLPETADMALYKNLKLQLTSVSSKLSVTTSNAHNYTFQGLTAGVAYELRLTNRHGQTIAKTESIMVTEGDNLVTLSDLTPLCNVEATVTDPENNRLTDKVRIAWLMPDGTPVADESTIKGLVSGTKLLCNVVLGDSLGCIYREVVNQEYLLAGRDNKINIDLIPIEKSTMTGKVLTENGSTVVYATVSVTEWLNGRYGKTLSVRTDSKGTFALDCHQDSLHVTIASDGYLDCVVDTVCASSTIDLGTLQLKEITGVVVTPKLNYKNAAEEDSTEYTDYFIDADNVDYSVTNLTTHCAVNDIKVQSGIIIVKSGANVGDQLSVRIHSRKGDFEDVTAETIVAEDETAEVVFNIVEKGGLKASYELSGNNEDIAMLYNADGALVSREFYYENSCTFSHLSDGHYTLLSMGKTRMLDAILNLSDFSVIGLTEGTDYVVSTLEIKAGSITTVSHEIIPLIDETLFYYTGTNTSFTANKSSVVVGNYITLTGRLDFKDEYAADVDDLSLVVDLPEGLEYVQGSAIIGTVLAPCSVDGKRLSISLNRNNYQERIRFCVVPTKSGTMMPSAYVAFSLDNEILQPIGSATITAKDMSLSVPTTVAKPEVTVSGVAVPYSKVTVYDGTTLIGQVTAKADGNWMVKGEMIEPYNLSTHPVYANVLTPQDITMNTEVVNVLYDKNAIEVKTVTMINTAHPAENLSLCEYKTVFDFQNPSQESPIYWYWPNYPDFTFIVDFTNNDTTVIDNVVLYVYTSDGKSINLVPTYDEKIDRYVASAKFYSGALPVNVNTSFYLITRSKTDVSNTFTEEVAILDEMHDDAINNAENLADYLQLSMVLDEDSTSVFEIITPDKGKIGTYKIEVLNYQAILSRIKSEQFDFEKTDLGYRYTLLESFDNIERIILIDTGEKAAYAFSVTDVDSGISPLTRALKAKNFSRQSIKLLKEYFKSGDWVGHGNTVKSILADQLGLNKYTTVPCFNQYVDIMDSYMSELESMEKILTDALTAKCEDNSYRLSADKMSMYSQQIMNFDSNIGLLYDTFVSYTDLYKAKVKTAAAIDILMALTSLGIGEIVGSGRILKNSKNAKYFKYWITNPTIRSWLSNSLGIVFEEVLNATSSIIAPEEGDFEGAENSMNEWMVDQRNKFGTLYKTILANIKNDYKNCIPKSESTPTIPKTLPDAQFVLDPSGYVYEAVTSNRLEGVTATIYQKVTTEDMYGDKHENIVKWDAEPYSQRNPIKTDANGLYSWDVPDGLWQVKFEKDGYETVYSDWLPVPPPQLDINVPMYQSVQPEVTDARGFESGVDFTFSKYMRPATFAEGTVTLSHNGNPISGQLKMLNVEKEPLDGVEYASHIKFVPDKSLNVGDEVILTISHEVKSYCGVTMEKDYTATLVIQPEIKEIAVDSVVNVGYGYSSVIEVAVLPADAAKGKIFRLQNGTPSILVTEVTTFTLDADGKTKIPVTGALPGTGALRLSVDDSDISADVKVNVITAPTEVAAPKSSMPSGSTVEKGSLIVLSCTTEGVTIYYTLDGSCPCDETTRLTYTEPIVINETVTIKAMAVASDMTESEIVEFTYIVDEGDGIDDVTIDENLKIYPLPVRDKLNVTAGGKIIKSVTLVGMSGSTVVSASKPVTHVTIDVSSLTTGIYIINVATEGKTYSRQIMKVE